MKKNAVLLIVSCIVALTLCELILRAYNPIPSRVKGNSIKLQANYKRSIELDEAGVLGLDTLIHYSTNSLGFRGDQPPASFEDIYTIFTIGGSTTECSLLDDSKTWTYVLGDLLSQDSDSIWINNAGIDGCSTYGHQALLSEHIFEIKPDMVVFLVGVNEILVAYSHSQDSFLETLRKYRLRGLSQKSELFAFLLNMYHLKFPKKIEIGHGSKREESELDKDEFDKSYAFYTKDQSEYKKRLDAMIKECLKRGITPVLVT